MKILMIFMYLFLLLFHWCTPMIAMAPTLASPEIQTATMCQLVYPKYGELIPVNVDREGNQVNSRVWVLIKCYFLMEARNAIDANDGFIFTGTQQVEPPDDVSLNTDKTAYVVNKINEKAPYFYLSSLEIDIKWGEQSASSKYMVFTINTCKRIESGKINSCIELSRLYSMIVRPTTELLHGLLASNKLKITDNQDHNCHSHSRNSVDTHVCNDNDIPKVFDFMEIGTSAFETIVEICKDSHTGITIEPIGIYQDMLPDMPNVHKLRFAVGPNDGFLPLYHFPKAVLDGLGYSLESKHERTLYGMGMLNMINPVQLDIAANDPENGDVLHFIQRDLVPVKTIQSIYTENNIVDIKVLKLDCEGTDYEIIISAMSYYEQFQKIYPRIIVFESNVKDHRSAALYEKALLKLHDKGYTTYRYMYHVEGPLENLQYVNSDIYAVHQTSLKSEIEEYNYMTAGVNEDGRGLKHAINICAPIMDNVEDQFDRHCNILVREDQDKSTDTINGDKCIAKSCISQ